MNLYEVRMGEIHSVIKKEYPHDEPLHIVHNNGTHAIVSAFDRSTRSKKKVWHVLKNTKTGWQHKGRENSLFDANQKTQWTVSEGFLPRKTLGPRARQPVISGVKVLRRSRGLTKPTTMRNRNLLTTDRAQHRARLGGRKNARTSVSLSRMKNLANKWFEKGRI